MMLRDLNFQMKREEKARLHQGTHEMISFPNTMTTPPLNDSGDFAVEGDGAIRDMQNEELGFLFASRRTRSGRKVTATRKASLWT